MAVGRRRDEWERWSQLLSLVDNRTQFGEGAKASRPIDFWPKWLLTRDDIEAVNRAEEAQKMPITMADFKMIVLGANRG